MKSVWSKVEWVKSFNKFQISHRKLRYVKLVHPFNSMVDFVGSQVEELWEPDLPGVERPEGEA